MVEITQAIAKQAGIPIDIQLEPAPRFKDRLLAGESDLLLGLHYSSARISKYDFSPAATSITMAMVHRAGESAPADLRNLGGRRLLVQSDSITEEQAVLLGHQEHVLPVATHEEALRRLAAGEGDYAMVPVLPALQWISKHGWENLRVSPSTFTADLCFAARRGEGAVLGPFSDGMANLERTGELQAIRQKWLGTTEIGVARILQYVAVVAVPLLALLISFIIWTRMLRRRVAQATARYRELFDAMVDGFAVHEIILDQAGAPCDYRFLSVNPAFERLTGLKAVDLLGRRIKEVNPQLEQVWIDTYGRVALTGASVHFEQYSAQQGRHFEVIAYRPAPGQFACVFSDISERKRAAAVLAEQEQRLRQLVDGLDAGVVIIDPATRRIESVNPYAVRLFGCDPGQLTGQVCARFLCDHEDGRCPVLDLGRTIENSEGVLRTADGGLIPILQSVRRITIAGQDKLLKTFVDVSVQKQAEQALVVSQQRYALAVTGSNDGIWDWDLRTNGLYLSPRWKAQLGYADDELPNEYASFRDRIHPEDTPRVMAVAQDCLEGRRELYEVEFRMRHKQDGWRWILARGIAVREADGRPVRMAGSHTDITARKQAEQDLRLAYAEAEELLSVLSGLLIGLDGQGRIVRFNAAAERLLGRGAAEVMGRPLQDCGVDLDWSAVMPLVEATLADGVSRSLHDVRCTREGGMDAFLDLTVNRAQPVGQAGRHVVIVGHDTTERRQLETQRLQGQKLEAVGHLAAGIAHEVNTPIQFIGDNLHFLGDALRDLGAVMTVVQALLREGKETDGELAQLAERIDLAYLTQQVPRAISQSLEGVARVTEIVRALKEFSHPDAGTKQPVDVNRCLLTTLTVARNEYKQVAEVVTDLAADLPAVPGMPGQLGQVFLNLVVNAAQAIAERQRAAGGRGSIGISTALRGGMVEIRISDDGMGIRPEHRRHLFTPFFTTKPVGQGTGQGLALCHAVVVGHHGGSIACESEYGRGSTFIIRLPVA